MFEMVKLSPKVAVPCALPLAMHESFCCSTYSPAFDAVSVPGFDHPYSWEEEKSTEDAVVGWHPQFNRHELGQTLGGGEGKPGMLQSMGSQEWAQLGN